MEKSIGGLSNTLAVIRDLLRTLAELGEVTHLLSSLLGGVGLALRYASENAANQTVPAVTLTGVGGLLAAAEGQAEQVRETMNRARERVSDVRSSLLDTKDGDR